MVWLVSVCVPLVDEEKSIQSGVSEGHMRVKASTGEMTSFEFITSNFGGKLPNQPFIIISNTEPSGACDPITPIDDDSVASAVISADSIDKKKEKSGIVTIVVARGKCHFDIKVKHVQDVGAQLMIVYDPDPSDGPIQHLVSSILYSIPNIHTYIHT